MASQTFNLSAQEANSQTHKINDKIKDECFAEIMKNILCHANYGRTNTTVGITKRCRAFRSEHIAKLTQKGFQVTVPNENWPEYHISWQNDSQDSKSK